jgi:DNA-directed RNA polymerase subunit beta'
VSCARSSRPAASTSPDGSQADFNDEDHLWAESLDVNVKKLSDEERKKLETDLRKTFTADIDDTEAYYEDARTRLKEVWKLFANRDEPSEDPPAEGEEWPLAQYVERAGDKDEFIPKKIIADETFFRELKHRFGSPYGFGEYFGGGMGAEHVRDLLREKPEYDREASPRDVDAERSPGEDLARRTSRASCSSTSGSTSRTRSRTARARSRPARSSA